MFREDKLRIFCLLFFVCFSLICGGGYCAEEESPLFWPPPPAEIKISFVKSVYSPDDLGIKAGFLKKLQVVFFGEEKNMLSKPMAVAVGEDGVLYICDAGEPAVHIYRKKEKRYKKITVIGKERLISPVGVAVAENGMIFIADSELKKVFCLDKEGKLKFIISPDEKFLRPTGLAVRKNKLYVVDTLAHSIFVFDLEGNFISRFGGRGKGDGEFNYPAYICADNEGKIYVADTLNFRIQVFDENNKFLYFFGKLGDSSGSFSRPKGVAVDSFGHIYVTDGMFDALQIFNKGRELLLFLGETGQEDGEFWIPSGIAADRENYIYVADAYNRRIQVFHYVGKD